MSAAAIARFVAVDWGATRMRVWLLGADGTPLAERRSDEGMLAAQPDRFAAILEAHLAALGALADLPVIICGMAGARQGWIEAPYVTVPTPMRAIFDAAVRVPGQARDIRILPGLAQRDAAEPDVMRGEETQLAGAGLETGALLACLPGTHSKWAALADGAVTGFQTFMTGELFSVLSVHSILRHSVAVDGPVEPDHPAFRQWCGEAAAGRAELSANLFRLRAATLLHGKTPEDGRAALSGLLIGAEIAGARRRFGTDAAEIVLVASGAMAELYRAAFELAGLPCRTVDADEAVRRGLAVAAQRCFGEADTGSHP
jgi:2-dehydro-3-deoxygalactonokinase